MSGKFLVWAAVVAALGLTIWLALESAQAAPLPQTAAATQTDEAIARATISDLVTRNFSGVEKRFDERMAAAAPLDNLTQMWDSIIAQNGAFQSIESVSHQSVQGVELYRLTCRFATARSILSVAIDAQHHVAGFFIAAAPAETTTQIPTASPNEQAARAFLMDLTAHNFDSAQKRFSSQVSALMPTPKLTETWNQVVASFGELQSVVALKTNPLDSSVVNATCKFSATTMDALFNFDARHLIVGFHIVPPTSEANDSWKAPGYAKPDSFTEQQITVGSAPWALPGTLTLPKGAGPFAAVVLVHGSGPENQDEGYGPNKIFKDIAWGLASRGIAVLRYEKRTHRYGKEMVTGQIPITVKEETIDDAIAALALLSNTPHIDAKHIYLAGHSLGGYLAPRIAAADSQIAGLILLAGSTRPLEDMVIEQIADEYAQAGRSSSPEAQEAIGKAQADKQAIEDPNLKPGVMLRLAGAQIPSEYFLDLRSYDSVRVAATLKIPMLILQGERDYQVTMTDFNNWKRGLGEDSNAVFKTYPALNHLFLAGSGPSTPQEYDTPGHVEADVIADISTWVQTQTAKSILKQ